MIIVQNYFLTNPSLLVNDFPSVDGKEDNIAFTMDSLIKF